MPVPVRPLIALFIGLAAGLFAYGHQLLANDHPADAIWAIRLLPALLAGNDPYDYPVSVQPMAYPLTAGIITWPLSWVPEQVGIGLFAGISSALLAFSLTQHRQWWRLLVFLSFPYVMSLYTVQWAPLLLAVAFYPILLPLTLAKPHIGLPIALTWLTWRRTLACAVLGLVSLALMPDWPFRWLNHQAATYRYIVPLLTLPCGPLLLLALRRWRDPPARLLFLFSCMPQHRWGYDTLVLWAVPQTPGAAILVVISGWVGAGGLLLTTWLADTAWGSAVSIIIWYMPLLAIVLQPKWMAGYSNLPQGQESTPLANDEK